MFIFVSYLEFFSCLLFLVCTCCPVLTCSIFSCPMTDTGFFETYICMYVYLAVHNYTTYVGRPCLSTLSQNVSMRLFLEPQQPNFPQSISPFSFQLIIIFVVANACGNEFSPQSLSSCFKHGATGYKFRSREWKCAQKMAVYI